MGGGAAGWCYQHLAVIPAGTAFDPTHAGDPLSYVFSISCGSDVKLEWATEERLRVSYSIAGGATVTQWPRTHDNSVALEYTVLQ
jgi:hypothetical protein